MPLRTRTTRIHILRSLLPRCDCVCDNALNQGLARYASSISKEEWYSRHGKYRRGVTPRPKKPVKQESTVPLNTKDIFVHDLAATLEAHRDTNRAKIIRKIPREPPQYKDKDWKHLAGLHDGKEIQDETSQEEEKPRRSSSEGSTNSGPGSSPHENPTERLRSSKPKDKVMVRRVLHDKLAKVRLLDSKKGLRTDLFNKSPIFPAPQTEDSQARSVQNYPVSSQPWMDHTDSSHEDHLKLLSSELRGLEAYMRLTPAEQKASTKVIVDARTSLLKAFGAHQLHLYGSRETDLAVPTSDFNIRISPEGRGVRSAATVVYAQNPGRKLEYQTLRRVQEMLECERHFANVRRIHARVSLVRAEHSITGASVEFQATTRFPSDTSKQVKALTEDLPSLRPLFVALRTCLEANDLKMSVNGGIGSYTLVIMIATALKSARDAFDLKDLGGQLLHVLHFWGSADLSNYAYSVMPFQVYEKRKVGPAEDESSKIPFEIELQRNGMDYIRQQSVEWPHLLCLQDPVNYRNDLGRNSFAIGKVQALFKAAHERMSNVPRTDAEDSRESAQSDSDPQSSILQNLLPADFTAFEQARSKLRQYADPKAFPPDTLERDGVLGHEQQANAIDYPGHQAQDQLLLSPWKLGQSATRPQAEVNPNNSPKYRFIKVKTQAELIDPRPFDTSTPQEQEEKKETRGKTPKLRIHKVQSLAPLPPPSQ